MPFFLPRIGKKYVESVYGIIYKHIFQNFERIVFDYKKIFQISLPYFAEQPPYTRTMHFYPDVIYLRIRRGNFGGCRTHSESYFDNHGIRISENVDKIDF